ncbi:LysM peptidoglycan-binding domain-containing protein [Phycicoccus sp. BSK3Z-2]|uniref:LysM peptidoglycan-binding domain-containing protein n=1 Tax=Phycicoccus avicenniae TaxID=2828860 RepID=A0A941D926_9MICO|nr:LysM peptidoglycan-binding domain-containing protein [Phycicoccus avicenniae]MBR7744339.1 LysM peptidoglycan-binding domain-containing protein [Phycicoccus avicenniae]
MSAIAWEPADRYVVPAPRRPRLTVVPHPAPAVAPSGAVRLTARGRLVLLVLAALLVASVLGFRGLGGADAAQAEQVVTVSPGQTLSEIAAAELPSMTISQGIVAIQVANAMSTAQVSAGQELVIPRG